MANRSRKLEQTNLETRKEAPARKRVPVSGNRDILTVHGKEDGFVYRWVNDNDNRVQRFLDAGYDFVEHDVNVGTKSVDNTDTSIGRVSKNVGRGVTSYLMRIDEDWYKEDQDAKQKTVNASEASLNKPGDGQYGNVKIE